MTCAPASKDRHTTFDPKTGWGYMCPQCHKHFEGGWRGRSGLAEAEVSYETHKALCDSLRR